MKKLFFFLLSSALLSHCSPTKTDTPMEEGHLLQHMAAYQRFTQKIWLAGEAGNWKLAAFYSHELEEITEEFVSASISHEGMNLSRLTNQLLEPALKGLDSAIESKNEVLFLGNYKILINSCNSCHAATGYDFIKITTPVLNPFNQKFRIDSAMSP